VISTGDTLWFELDGTPSHTPAWQAINAVDLQQPAERRGTEPWIVPGASGGIPQPMRAKPTERIIDVQVFGYCDSDGVPTDEWAGMRANLAALRAAWGDLPATPDSTRTLVLHDVDAGDTTGEVQVLGFVWTRNEMPAKSVVSLRILLPMGELS
jgi:hypothetical protein